MESLFSVKQKIATKCRSLSAGTCLAAARQRMIGDSLLRRLCLIGGLLFPKETPA
jgi:hypothetical protein